MLRHLFVACVSLALLQTHAVAGTQYLGTISMYICDNGEDLCSNTLTSSPVNLPAGPFVEDFGFDFVNDFPHNPDDVPLLQATVLLETTNQSDFSSSNFQLYNPFGTPFGFEIQPLGLGENGFSGRTGGLIYPGVGYYVEVTGVSNSSSLPLQVSVSAFDLGPIIAPEPSTWAMMLIGLGGLGLVTRWRASSLSASDKKLQLVVRRAQASIVSPSTTL